MVFQQTFKTAKQANIKSLQSNRIEKIKKSIQIFMIARINAASEI